MEKAASRNLTIREQGRQSQSDISRLLLPTFLGRAGRTNGCQEDIVARRMPIGWDAPFPNAQTELLGHERPRESFVVDVDLSLFPCLEESERAK